MRKLVLLLFYSVVFVSLTIAQVRKISGVVISEEDGQPVAGASVVVKGTGNGTITDTEGVFSFNLDISSPKTLVVSFIGMETEEVSATPHMNIVLKSNFYNLDEVVVVAYGKERVKTVTASISSIRKEELKDLPSVSLDQMMQGRASGVSITTPSAGVLQSSIVRVRGVNSITSGTNPLYVIDGIPISTEEIGVLSTTNPLSNINPSDIVSIDILKDAAAAAMYGSRAANGVILITTKQGQGGKLKVNYDGFVGFSNVTGNIDMMNAQEYVDFKNMSVRNRYGTDEISLTNGYVSPYGNKAFNMMTDSKGNYIDSNWKDAVYQNGFTQNHTVSANGGSETVQYYFSGNYLTQDGIVKGDEFQRLGVRANVNAQAAQWLKVGMNTSFSNDKGKYADSARGGDNFSTNGFPRVALVNPPNTPIYNEDGTPNYTLYGIGYGGNTVYHQFPNPAAVLEQGSGLKNDAMRFIGSFYAEINPIKGLYLKSLYGIDYTRLDEERFHSPKHLSGAAVNGFGNAYSTKNNMWTFTNTANYVFSIDQHNFDILAGMETTKTDYSTYGMQRTDLQDDKFTVIQGPFSSTTGDGSLSHSSMISYFARLNYNIASKYILSVNYRRDGHSALSRNNRWGNFGGASAAWRISEENFFQPIHNVVNDLKIKGSFGVVGNTDIYNYESKSYYSGYFYGENNTYELARIADPNLKWESLQKYDIGISGSFLNRVNIELDYYYTRSSDLILDVPQTPSKGIPGGYITSNAGKMRNSGIEVTLSADVIRNNDFTWSTNFNITTNHNKVISLADGVKNIIGTDQDGAEVTNITVPGKSISQLYLYPTAGVDPETGRRVFIGSNGERTLLMYDKLSWFTEDGEVFDGDFEPVICGNTLPTWYGGWGNNFMYKGFDLYVFLQFSGGNKIYNGTKATVSDMRQWNNSKDVLNNYWSPENKNATYPLPVYGDNYSNGSYYPISDWVEKGDYLRLKNISLGYTFNTNKWKKALGVSSLRLYTQIQNLFVITGYTGMDPEVLSNTKNYTLAGGTDKNTLPQARTYTFGVNISF